MHIDIEKKDRRTVESSRRMEKYAGWMGSLLLGKHPVTDAKSAVDA